MGLFRMSSKKYNKFQLFMFKLLGKRAKPIQPAAMISASKDMPNISTLVYKDPAIDYPTSETFQQDKLIANAKQVLAIMDPTTASMH
jgi:hypothetical protein